MKFSTSASLRPRARPTLNNPSDASGRFVLRVYTVRTGPGVLPRGKGSSGIRKTQNFPLEFAGPPYPGNRKGGGAQTPSPPPPPWGKYPMIKKKKKKKKWTRLDL